VSHFLKSQFTGHRRSEAKNLAVILFENILWYLSLLSLLSFGIFLWWVGLLASLFLYKPGSMIREAWWAPWAQVLLHGACWWQVSKAKAQVCCKIVSGELLLGPGIGKQSTCFDISSAWWAPNGPKYFLTGPPDPIQSDDDWNPIKQWSTNLIYRGR